MQAIYDVSSARPTHRFVRTRKLDGVVMFSAPLKCAKCTVPTCRTYVSIGGPYCATHRKRLQGIVVKTSQGLASINIVGNGVYAAREFAKHEIVCMYDCERVSEQRIVQLYGKHGTRIYALNDKQSLIDETAADAALDRIAASLINDAYGLGTCEKPCRNNVYFCDRSQPYCIRARRRIRTGSELFLSYGDDYWNGFDEMRDRCETVEIAAAALTDG